MFHINISASLLSQGEISCGTVSRRNFFRVLRGFYLNNDRAKCLEFCECLRNNELKRAKNDPVRGPDAQSENLPSGSFTYGERYRNRFSIFNRHCMRICNSMGKLANVIMIV